LTAEELKKNLTGLTKIRKLHLPFCGPGVNEATDVISQLTTLIVLDIRHCGIRDQGFKPLQKLSNNIKDLRIGGNPLTDAVLDDLEQFTKVEQLVFDECRPLVSWAGLARLKMMKNIASLGFGYTGLTDDDLAHLKELSKLRIFYLMGNPISDKGLASVAAMTNLTTLNLDRCPAITDAGLDHLRVLKKLELIDMRNTKVTADGVKKLAAALPGCKIEWDGGTIEP
jgi:F-box/leucine-rich repeat protein 14